MNQSKLNVDAILNGFNEFVKGGLSQIEAIYLESKSNKTLFRDVWEKLTVIFTRKGAILFPYYTSPIEKAYKSCWEDLTELREELEERYQLNLVEKEIEQTLKEYLDLANKIINLKREVIKLQAKIGLEEVKLEKEKEDKKHNKIAVKKIELDQELQKKKKELETASIKLKALDELHNRALDKRMEIINKIDKELKDSALKSKKCNLSAKSIMNITDNFVNTYYFTNQLNLTKTETKIDINLLKLMENRKELIIYSLIIYDLNNVPFMKISLDAIALKTEDRIQLSSILEYKYNTLQIFVPLNAKVQLKYLPSKRNADFDKAIEKDTIELEYIADPKIHAKLAMEIDGYTMNLSEGHPMLSPCIPTEIQGSSEPLELEPSRHNTETFIINEFATLGIMIPPEALTIYECPRPKCKSWISINLWQVAFKLPTLDAAKINLSMRPRKGFFNSKHDSSFLACFNAMFSLDSTASDIDLDKANKIVRTVLKDLDLATKTICTKALEQLNE